MAGTVIATASSVNSVISLSSVSVLSAVVAVLDAIKLGAGREVPIEPMNLLKFRLLTVETELWRTMLVLAS